MPQIMTTKELAKYLKFHEITVCKYAAAGRIPAIRIGRVWRFDKDVIDRWIAGGQQEPEASKQNQRTIVQKKSRNKRGRRRNV